MNFRSTFFLVLFTAGSLFSLAAEKSNAPQYGKTNIADMVLIYHGGVHRTLEWNIDCFMNNLTRK